MTIDISVITLGVLDTEKAEAFYRDGFGFNVLTKKGPVVYLATGGTRLALFDRVELAKYAGVAPNGAGFDGLTLSHNLPSRDAVDALVSTVTAAGATITQPPTEHPWGGYTAWFSDLDGHLWEAIWNPRPFL